jgi:hypothetical protein
MSHTNASRVKASCAGPDLSQRDPPLSPRRFAQSLAVGDIDGVVALLTDDAWLNMPPAPHQYHGPVAIAAFLRASGAWASGHGSEPPSAGTRRAAAEVT